MYSFQQWLTRSASITAVRLSVVVAVGCGIVIVGAHLDNNLFA